MHTLRKKIQAQANEAKANLDAAILNLRNARFEQFMSKLEGTKARIEQERDMAWNLASRVLAKVRSVRESLQRAVPTARVQRPVKAAKAKLLKVKSGLERIRSSKPKTKTKKKSTPAAKKPKRRTAGARN